MTSLAGTRALVRLALRRDRIMLPAWLAVFISLAAASASATAELYPTVVSRVSAAQAFNGTPALVALYGRVYDPTSLGALAMIKAAGTGAIFVAVFAIITVVRHTRAEEETGRAELLGAAIVGRFAPLTSALIVALVANIALAAFTTVSLIAAGLPAAGSVGFGLAWAGTGLAFAATAGCVAQLTRIARVATGTSIAILGVVYVLRGLGDSAPVTGPRWLTWLSPIGWGQQFRPFAGDRWWVLAITLAFTAATTAAAFALVTRRDLGGGVLPDRPGPARGRRLNGPLALAWRLERWSLLAWAAGFALLGLVFGGIATNLDGFLDSPQAKDLFTTLGGANTLTDAFVATELGFVAVFASAYGVHAALRVRSEEEGLRAESILATATSRQGWLLSHVAIAIGGTSLLMLVTGTSAGLALAAQVGDLGRGFEVLGAALAYLPATWVLTAIVVACYGISPRLATAGWVALVVFVLLGELGPLLELPRWVMDVSPFAHIPRLPAAPFDAVPLIGSTLVASILVTMGLALFARRDVHA